MISRSKRGLQIICLRGFTYSSPREALVHFKRMQTSSQSLANKLNSGEKFNTNTNFETELTLIRTPSAFLTHLNLVLKPTRPLLDVTCVNN